MPLPASQAILPILGPKSLVSTSSIIGNQGDGGGGYAPAAGGGYGLEVGGM